MRVRSIFFKIFLGGIILLAIQFATFHTISHRMLERELLGAWYQRLVHNSDSAFVRDFYVADCYVGETNVHPTHNLGKNEQKLCEKLRVKCIKFERRETFRWDDYDEFNYKLRYYTWTSYPMSSIDRNWQAIAGFYVSQDEHVRIGKITHARRVNYLWLLFGWVEISEMVYSTGPEDRKAILARLGRFEDIRY